jgi:hypothetical protein
MSIMSQSSRLTKHESDTVRALLMKAGDIESHPGPVTALSVEKPSWFYDSSVWSSWWVDGFWSHLSFFPFLLKHRLDFRDPMKVRNLGGKLTLRLIGTQVSLPCLSDTHGWPFPIPLVLSGGGGGTEMSLKLLARYRVVWKCTRLRVHRNIL